MVVVFLISGLESFVRMKMAWKVGKSVKKILNGGGGLSDGLIQDAIKFFPRAKILSAYGASLFALLLLVLLPFQLSFF